jgi:hypothetical protein
MADRFQVKRDRASCGQLQLAQFNSNFNNKTGIKFTVLDPTSEAQVHLHTHLLGDIVSLEEFEVCDGAGRLLIPDRRRSARNLFPLRAYLVEKTGLALAVTHTRRGRLGLEIIDETVRRRIG